jgi:hypothetical protein
VALDGVDRLADEPIVFGCRVDEREDETGHSRACRRLEARQSHRLHELQKVRARKREDRLRQVESEVIVEVLEASESGERVGRRQLADAGRTIQHDELHESPLTAAHSR